MKWGQLKHLILLLLILFVMSFLFIKSNAADPEKHKQLLDSSRQFNHVDAELNQAILEIRQGLLLHYDTVNNNMTELSQLESNIEKMLYELYSGKFEMIAEKIKSLDQVIKEKEALLERFKFSNSLLRNSLRYLPAATTVITASLPSTVKSLTFQQSLNALIKDILIYNLTSEKETLLKINNKLTALQNRIIQNFPLLKEDVNLLVSHAYIVLEHKNKLNDLTQKLITLNTTESMNALLFTYNSSYALIVKTSNRYRNGLYGLSILLVIYISYILLRLNYIVAHLHSTIFEREQIEKDLHASELRFRNMIEQSPFSIQVFSPDGHTLQTNQAWKSLWGNKLETFPEDSIFENQELIDKDLMPYIKKGFSGESINIPPVTYNLLEDSTEDGLFNERWIRAFIYPVINKEDRIHEIILMHEDVTEHIQREQKLLDSEKQYRNLIESMHDLFQSVNAEGRFIFVNSAWRNVLEYNSQEMSELTIWDIIHPDAIQKCQKIFSKINSGEPVNNLDTIFISKTGKNIYVEGNISCKYSENKLVATHAVFRDVTARKKAEKEKNRMEVALRRSQKMDAIGQLSGGIAHDFNNQLGVIVGYLDFLKGVFSEGDKPLKWVNTATRATLRCMDLTRQLLSFSRHQGASKAVVNINTCMNEMETMVKRSVTPEVDVQYYLADDLWLTEIDSGEFQDAILNLVINARDAMPNGGKLIIETTNKYLGADFVSFTPETNPGEYIQLMFSDTGTGMSKETLEHVFEPFFTTKSKDKGTGLGMAMVYGFVKRYGGIISIYSEPDLGTTIRMYLPRSTASENVQPENYSDEKIDLPTGDESILIVDDEADLLHLADQYLAELGYKTHLAENALQALEMLANDNDFKLLFSDVVMPGGMNGYDLAQRATEINPALKILMTSGFTGKNITHNGLSVDPSQLLNKPYRKNDLAYRIRIVLDKEKAA